MGCARGKKNILSILSDVFSIKLSAAAMGLMLPVVLTCPGPSAMGSGILSLGKERE